jgi:hypothetical protein
MLAFGAATSVGDQLHPSGEIDQSTYEIIRQAFEETESKRPWVTGQVVQVVDIAVYSRGGHVMPGVSQGAARHDPSDGGAVRVLWKNTSCST